MDGLRTEVMTRSTLAMGVVAGAAALLACRDTQATSAVEDTAYRQRPGYIIDSVRPISVELDRFRADLGPAPTALTGGAGSLDGLIARFATAVEANDTTALQRMQISAAEFAWLIYPSSPFTQPPYQQAPQVVWMQLRVRGDVGLHRLLARRGGSPLAIVGHGCDPRPELEGENRIWKHCAVRTVRAPADTATERLFGVVLERGGQFKFASYQNQY